jgi:hypothetical protein
VPVRYASRRLGAVGVALTAYDVWRRIPKRHRRAILAAARKHGPRAAAAVARTARSRTTRKR